METVIPTCGREGLKFGWSLGLPESASVINNYSNGHLLVFSGVAVVDVAGISTQS